MSATIYYRAALPAGPETGDRERLRALAAEKMLEDHIYAIECGPLDGHVDNRDDEDQEFGFAACPHPDCVLVRQAAPAASEGQK